MTANNLGAFVLRDCALIAIATGQRAQNLKELRDILLGIHSGSLYFHFWGGLLQARFEEREYNNDFAAWARHSLHDAVLAERLSVVDPTELADLEALRQELIDIVEQRVDEHESLAWTAPDQQFEFIRSQIVVFDTRRRVEQPEQLAVLLPNLSTSSVFYHFIDARRRSAEGLDDFRTWLGGFGARYAALVERLAALDPYFVSLSELRAELAALFAEYFEVASHE
jgi:hypothetical protein